MNVPTDSHTASKELRVWLVATLSNAPEPADRPIVRDDMMRTWLPTDSRGYCSSDGRRTITWAELHARFDLVEVI
ncbi:hypothetical protein [Antrihabitans stalactiti]|uniref:Uncharacterized protein n=1 Tax=Antrihabitans stalactiti TaxID=2584121 RepID=A0A848K5T9_9NOCA|nr:hypothetical protein [Antrihabitans stalactiti]NMN93931.1 hypothetical protein [Antrihabitans stalactiti]